MIPYMKMNVWQKTRHANLVRYVPSGVYFIRAKVNGKLIRESLKTDTETVAKLKLLDRLSELRNQPANKSASKMSFQEAAAVFKQRVLQGIPLGSKKGKTLKPNSQEYRLQTLQSINRVWPALDRTQLRLVSKSDCERWAEKYAEEYSATRFNGALETLRAVFSVGIEQGAIVFNPAQGISRKSVKQKTLTLPTQAQFAAILRYLDKMETSPDAADLVRGLSYTGMRKSEARNFQWPDIDFDKSRFAVRGDPEYGTKNSEVRYVPMIPELRILLNKLKCQGEDGRVFKINECRYSLASACKAVGCQRITHHDLRHLFATRCIESGVDIPTVSRWLGHKDGGTLAMKTYGHLRDEHSDRMAKRVKFANK
jgi:integrase